MTKYAYEYGQRWNRLTPRNAVKWLVDKMHVGTPDAEVADKIRARCENAALGETKWTPAITEESVRYALLVHARNRDLYQRVASGRI